MKYRIRKIEYNNGKILYIPEQRKPKNPAWVYIFLTVFFPLWIIVFIKLFQKFIDGKTQVFNPYKWERLTEIGQESLGVAKTFIDQKIQYYKYEKMQQIKKEIEQHLHEVKQQTFLKYGNGI